MKHLFFILSAVFLFIKCPGQPIQYYSGAILDNYAAEKFRLFGQDSSALYAFVIVDDIFFLDIFSKESLQRTEHVKIPIPVNHMVNYEFEELIVRKDTFHLFYSYFERIELCEKLEMITFTKDATGNERRVLIDKSEGKSIRKAGRFSVLTDNDSNKFLSFGSKPVKDTWHVNLDHFDYSGNKIHSQDFRLYESWNILHTLIDEDYNIITIAKSQPGNKNADWRLQIYSPNSDHPKIIELYKPSSGNIYLSDFFNWVTDNQKFIVFASPYSSKPSATESEGVYLAKINPRTHVLMSEHVIPFKKYGEGDDTRPFSLPSCMLRDMMMTSNDGLKLVFETGLWTLSTFFAIPIAQEYNIGSIISVELNSKSQVTEIRKIKKQQETLKSGYPFTGFFTLCHGDTTYFVYNELPENLQRSPDKMKLISQINIDKTVVIYTVVDSGKVVRKKLGDKITGTGMDAVLPISALTGSTKKEVFVVSKQKDKFYLTKFFTTD